MAAHGDGADRGEVPQVAVVASCGAVSDTMERGGGGTDAASSTAAAMWDGAPAGHSRGLTTSDGGTVRDEAKGECPLSGRRRCVFTMVLCVNGRGSWQISSLDSFQSVN